MTDFPKIIRQLEKSGMTQRQIAKEAGISHAQINRIKNHNQTPNFTAGYKLTVMRIGTD